MRDATTIDFVREVNRSRVGDRLPDWIMGGARWWCQFMGYHTGWTEQETMAWLAVHGTDMGDGMWRVQRSPTAWGGAK